MSLDGIIFRESAHCVPWRHIAEVPGSWKEVCSSLVGTAKHGLAQERGGGSSSPPVPAQHWLPVCALLWSHPRAFIKSVSRFPQGEG